MKTLVILLFLLAAFNALAVDNVGKTIVARGQVAAENPESTRELSRRSPIYLQDLISTGANSDTQLRMIDGGLLSLQQQTELAIDDYQFNQQSQQSKVNLSLIKGGLRTVTGSLMANSKQYQLKTPVASIGVRGTHYSAELVSNDLFLGVWQGVIDVKVLVSKQPMEFSLGDDEDYKFAIVRANGEVEFSLQVPNALSVGHSEPMILEDSLAIAALSKEEQAILIKPLNTIDKFQHSYLYQFDDEFDQSGDGFLDNDDTWAALIPTSPEVIMEKSGTIVFDHILEHSLSSSLGSVSDAAMSMTVNFDTGRVPTGQLALSDNGGEWFAVYNGVVGVSGLEININFASHGDELADGEISGLFLNNATQVLGTVSLAESANTNVTASGSYLLIDKP